MIIDPYRYAVGGGGGPGPSLVTWNPADKGSTLVLSNGDLTATAATAAWRTVRSTHSASSGLRYFEATLDAQAGSGFVEIGVATNALNLEAALGDTGATGGYAYQSNGFGWANGSSIGTGFTTFAPGDVIGVFMDFTSALLTFRKNGSGTGCPSVASIPAGALFAACAVHSSPSAWSARFDPADWVHAPGGGYVAWDA